MHRAQKSQRTSWVAELENKADGGSRPAHVTTRIIMIRHAATDAGARLCGSFDVPLSPAGRAQLETMLRGAPRHTAPDALFTSTLQRAEEVAAALGGRWGLLPRPAEWAREIHCGLLEGWTLEAIRREYPEAWTRNAAQDDDSFAWPGGESYAEFRERVRSGFSRLAAEHPDRRIAVVTHAGVVSQVLGLLEGRPPACWSPDRPEPLTATEVSWDADGPRTLLSFSCAEWY